MSNTRTPHALPALEEIRRRRSRLGMTQTELARIAGVSQSQIAKVERGRIEPSYRNVSAILNALEAASTARTEETRVGAIATKLMVRFRPDTLLTQAARTLRAHSISQAPVMEGEYVVGALTDRIVVECLADPARLHRIGRLTVGDVMDSPFPQLDAESPSHMAAGLLREASAVLVTRRGRLAGIVTQSDLFKEL